MARRAGVSSSSRRRFLTIAPTAASFSAIASTPHAENLHNLEDGYYERLLAGKSPTWIQSRLQNKRCDRRPGLAGVADVPPRVSCLDRSAESGAEAMMFWSGLISAASIRRRCSRRRSISAFWCNTKCSASMKPRRCLRRRSSASSRRTIPAMRFVVSAIRRGPIRGQATEQSSFDVFRRAWHAGEPAPVKHRIDDLDAHGGRGVCAQRQSERRQPLGHIASCPHADRRHGGPLSSGARGRRRVPAEERQVFESVRLPAVWLLGAWRREGGWLACGHLVRPAPCNGIVRKVCAG